MKCFKLVSILPLFFCVSIFVGCSDDEEPVPVTAEPIASFQFEIDDSDFSTVIFSNFSQNATSYMWNFGDGNSSTDENPRHTYSVAGSYDVELTASGATSSRSVIKSITIADPDSELKKITGDNSKIWKLSRNIDDQEYPLQVGPADKSQIWWALGLNDPIGSRPCLMEEEYIFAIDGSYTYVTNGAVFADFGIWSEEFVGQCVDDTDPAMMTGKDGDDLSPWGAGSFTFDYDPSGGTLTLNGTGAHVGLPKVGTNSETAVPLNSVEYTVTNLETDGPVDKMVLETSIDGGYWQFFLVSYDDPADEPELPGAPPTASFDHVVDGRTVTFTNKSIDADSYSWDFGDGGMSMAESPVHTYDSDGQYTVNLVASNNNGSSETSVNVIISSNSVFSTETVHGGGMKTWRLNPDAGALAVGPSKGSGEWFATSVDDVTTRACTFDDTYDFDVMGVFNYSTNGDLWAESYMGIDPAGCIMEGDLPADAAAWGSGSHSFTVTDATDTDPAYISVSGTGAFIGLPKAFNGGEYASGPPSTDGTVTYEVLSYVKDGDKETLVLTLDISENQGGGAYWTFTLSSE